MLLEHKEPKEILVQLVLKVHREQQVLRALKASKVSLVPQVLKVHKGLRAHKVLKEPRVLKVHRVSRVK